LSVGVHYIRTCNVYDVYISEDDCVVPAGGTCQGSLLHVWEINKSVLGEAMDTPTKSRSKGPQSIPWPIDIIIIIVYIIKVYWTIGQSKNDSIITISCKLCTDSNYREKFTDQCTLK